MRTDRFLFWLKATVKFPKNKERFVPLEKWKEDALQFVAQSRGSKGNTPIGDAEIDNKDKAEIDATPSSDRVNIAQATPDAPQPTEVVKIEVITAEVVNPMALPEDASSSNKRPESDANPIETTVDELNSNVPSEIVNTSAETAKVEDSEKSAEPTPHESKDSKNGTINDSNKFTPENPQDTNFNVTDSSESTEKSNSVPSSKELASAPSNASHPSTTDEKVNNSNTQANIISNTPSPSSQPNPPAPATAPTLPAPAIKDHSKNASNASATSTNQNHSATQVASTEPAPVVTTAPSAPSNPPQPSTKPSKSRRLRKNRINYASHDCGAKVLASNLEAVDPSAVLVGSKDRYMLNPCSAPRQFIVVELCEAVGVDHIQIGNFEFFSSMIKDVQVLASNRYPTTSWAVLGNFTIANERELQSLDFGEESELFPEWFKYLQIRILSHYGNEYYCPITEIQVHGLPYVEKLQRELQQNAREATVAAEYRSADRENASAPGVFDLDGPTIDSVVPMDEYLAAHALEAIEHFNSIYNTEIPLSQSLPASTSVIMPAPTTPRAPTSVERGSEQDRSYDVVHQPVASPPAKVGGDDEMDEIEDENSGEGSERPSEGSEKAKPNLGASAIPTMNLIQMIVQRVKKIEIDQSLLSGYLSSVSSLHQGEINEIGEALNELNQNFRFISGLLANRSRTQELLEAKVSALTENLHPLQEQVDTIPRAFRIYLAISALVALAICITCLFTVVIIFRCLPTAGNSSGGLDVLGRSSSSGSVHGLFRSNSDIRLDILRRSGSLGALKTEDSFSLISPPAPSTTPTLPQSDHVMTMSTPPPSHHSLANDAMSLTSDNSSVSSDRSLVDAKPTLMNPQAHKPYNQLKMEHQAELESSSSDTRSASSIAVRDVLSSHIRRHSDPNSIRMND